MTDLIDLNAAFGQALIDHFFKPVPMGLGPTGEVNYAPSGVSLLAQELYRQHGNAIRDQVWKQVDLDDLAGKIAGLVVTDLVRSGRFDYQRNVHKDDLMKRVLEIVAQQLGQRVVDQLDVTLDAKQIEGEVSS